MFGFFKRKKSEEDPLSDLKTVSRWMQDLPAGDIYTAQEQVVQSLIQFNHAGLAMSKERLQVLMHLDDQARDMQYSLCVQYLRNPRMSKVIESRLWTAIHAFYWEITRGYHAFLMDFVANPGGSKVQPAIPLITARAVRGFADIFKWRYFRYERVEEKLWQRLHNLYRISEFDSFQNNRFKLYPGDAKASSCMEEYLQALLLSPLGAGSLTPKQIEMVDHWLDNWSDLTSLETRYEPGKHFLYVDAAKAQGLRRIREDLITEPSFRYLSVERLLEHLDQAERALKSGTLPASLGLGEEFRLPDGYDLLNYVSNEWSPTNERERRLSPRQATDGRCEVVHDLSNICSLLRAEHQIATGTSPNTTLSPEEILDIKLYGFVTERTKFALSQRLPGGHDVSVEQWPMYDRSENGMGIMLKGEDSDWVKVGKLLALRLDPAHSWLIGVVRRITRMPDDMRRIGVQMLDSMPILIQLEPHDPAEMLMYSVEDASYEEVPPSPALIFPSGRNRDLIIVESARYAYGRQYRLRDTEGIHLIRLDSVKDKGDGWLLCTYTQVA
jgi:cyclic-di-GMP-binding protein